MGARNVKSVYANWAHLPHGPFRLLTYMSLTAMDADLEPKYWGGRDSLAVAYGRLERVADREVATVEQARQRDAAYLAVKRGLRVLRHAGAITLLNVAGPGHQSIYRLNLDGPVDESPRSEGITR